ncbi:unnamed protein product [Closterium sp. Yama58-4]|nr:unnamed protein product [Closterium sp. Yama58-4]
MRDCFTGFSNVTPASVATVAGGPTSADDNYVAWFYYNEPLYKDDPPPATVEESADSASSKLESDTSDDDSADEDWVESASVASLSDYGNTPPTDANPAGTPKRGGKATKKRRGQRQKKDTDKSNAVAPMEMVRRVVPGGSRPSHARRRRVDPYSTDEEDVDHGREGVHGSGDGPRKGEAGVATGRDQHSSDDDVVEVKTSVGNTVPNGKPGHDGDLHAHSSDKTPVRSHDVRFDSNNDVHIPQPASSHRASQQKSLLDNAPPLHATTVSPPDKRTPPCSQVPRPHVNNEADHGRMKGVSAASGPAGNTDAVNGRPLASSKPLLCSPPRNPSVSQKSVHAGPARSSMPDNQTPVKVESGRCVRGESGEQSPEQHQLSPMQASCGRGSTHRRKESTSRGEMSGRPVDVLEQLQGMLDALRSKCASREGANGPAESNKVKVTEDFDILGEFCAFKGKLEEAAAANEPPEGVGEQSPAVRVSEGIHHKPGEGVEGGDGRGGSAPMLPISPQPSTRKTSGRGADDTKHRSDGPLNRGLFTKRDNHGELKGKYAPRQNASLAGRRVHDSGGAEGTEAAYEGSRGVKGGAGQSARGKVEVEVGRKRVRRERAGALVTVVLDFDPEDPERPRKKGFPDYDDITEYAEEAMELLLRTSEGDGVTYFPSNAVKNEMLRLVLRNDWDVTIMDVRRAMKSKDYSSRVAKVWTRFKNESSTVARRYILDGLGVNLAVNGVYKLALPVNVKAEYWRRWAPSG